MESSTITTVSYIAHQLFEHAHAGQFWAILEVTAALQTSQYTHLPSIWFLCLINMTIARKSTGLTLVSQEMDVGKAAAQER